MARTESRRKYRIRNSHARLLPSLVSHSEQYAELSSSRVALEVVELDGTHLRVRRSEVMHRLRDARRNERGTGVRELRAFSQGSVG